MSKAERRLMDEAGEAGLRSGATVSIHVGLGRMAGFSFASSLSVPLPRAC
ncbi:hypothetical protein F0357_21550 [Rhizobiales bacterium Sp-1]|uniref:Transcription factor LuxR-like autoinducer-binding domain-containing protein n=1 Tax=Segnochrobactrum spirostomi TaxID=2608987 RepID=A0A6A7Y8J7_9HYPH|nr:hypothetical protein [Segnochrobactrum spirostomi]